MKIKLLMVREGRTRTVTIQGPKDAFEFMRRKSRRLDREHFWRIDLDARNQILGYEVVSVGTLTASLVHVRELFKGAILGNAASILVAHNHPSQETQPSPEDKEVTRRIKQAGDLLGIPLQDHLILADDRYFSFREEGLLS